MARYRRAKVEGGVFFFTVALADRSSDLPGAAHRQAARGLHIRSRTLSIRDDCDLRIAGPPARHLVAATGRYEFSSALEPDQEWIFSRAPCRCATQLQQDSKARERDLAAPRLGTHHSRRCPLGSSCRLYSLQSGQAWTRVPDLRLAPQ